MAELEGSPFYRMLSAILEDYFADLPRPVTLVSVNSGDLLPPAPRGSIRIVNLPPLAVRDFEALVAAADLLLTENCFSATLGKAICADVPALAWRNSFDVEALLARVTSETPSAILEAVLQHPAIVKPWVAFPWWTPDVQRGLSVLDRNSVAAAFTRLEIFGDKATAETVRRLFLDDHLRERLTMARREYIAKILQLPDCYEAICAAVSSPVPECPPPISSC
jgi:hypothetical protein